MIWRLLPHPVLTLLLALIWTLLVNSTSPGQIVMGVLLGWAIPLFTLRFWPERARIARPLTLLIFVAVVLRDIVIANLTVARLILGRPKNLTPVLLELPLDLRSDLAISILANTITLTPGTLSARLAEDRSCLLVHALNSTDPQALADTIKQRYEARLKEVFEP
jgi:multicomponent K+:H+ antiporter subunit E